MRKLKRLWLITTLMIAASLVLLQQRFQVDAFDRPVHHSHNVIGWDQLIPTRWDQARLVHVVRLKYGIGWFSFHTPY